MSKFNNAPTFTAAAFGAAALFSMLSFGGNAEAASVLSCKGTTASSVKSCCQQLVRANGRPVWMVQSGSSCEKATVCRGGLAPIAVAAIVVKPCYIQAIYPKEGGGKKEDNTPSRGRK